VYWLTKPNMDAIKVYDIMSQATRDLAAGPSSSNPTWAPDGQWIASLAHALHPSSGEEDSYYLIRPWGEGKEALVRAEILNGPLLWSPDSRFVVYDGIASGSQERRLWARRLEDGIEDWLATIADRDASSYQWVQNPNSPRP